MTKPPQLLDDALAIWHAGVEAVKPSNFLRESLAITKTQFQVEDAVFDLEHAGRIVVVGAGKASAAMTHSLWELLPQYWKDSRRIEGWVNIPQGTIPPQYDGLIKLFEARPTGCNEPTEAAMLGTKEICRLLENCSPKDLVVVLLSGGGSALLPLPIPGVELQDKLALTRWLSDAGAPIEDLNEVRSAISQVKRGGLARRCRASQMVTLVLSDVLGDSLATIGSGPTWLATPPNPNKAIQLLEKYWKQQRDSGSDTDWLRRINQSLHARIATEGRSTAAHSPSAPQQEQKRLPEVEHFVLASNAHAVDGAGTEAVARGFRYLMISEQKSEGEAEIVGAKMVESILHCCDGENAPDCLIHGGEPVVTLTSRDRRGKGGRNQHLVLAALIRWMELEAQNVPMPSDFCILSAGSDGEDGPTDAAGAWFTPQVLEKVRRLQLNPVKFLEENNSYEFFERVGGLLKTGPTGTNVCDLRVAIWK